MQLELRVTCAACVKPAADDYPPWRWTRMCDRCRTYCNYWLYRTNGLLGPQTHRAFTSPNLVRYDRTATTPAARAAAVGG